MSTASPKFELVIPQVVSCFKVAILYTEFPLALVHLEQHRYWQFALAVLPPLADSLSPTPVVSFGQSPPVRTSNLSVHLLSSTVCLLSPSRVECPWQKQHLSLYIVRWSVGCALVSFSTSEAAKPSG